MNTILRPEPRKAYYFYRIHRAQDNWITEFCVTNHQNDPFQYVETLAFKEGLGGDIGIVHQRWEKREEGDLLVFKAPDGYLGGAIGWCYDNSLQVGEHMPYDQLDREQLRNQVSLIVNGFRDLDK